MTVEGLTLADSGGDGIYLGTGSGGATNRNVAIRDVGVSYAADAGALSGLELTVGVENVGDEEPPLFPSYTQANTDPSQYDVLGRRYLMNLRYRF